MTAIAPANLPHLKQCFVTTLTEHKDADVEGVGTIRFGGGGDVYRWVKNSCGATISAGYAVIHDLTNDLHEILAQVIKPATNLLVAFAGIVKSTTIPDGEYGWIQIAGVAEDALCYGSTGIVLGDSLIPYNGVYHLVHSTDDSVANVQHRCCLALEAYAVATAANKSVLIMGCL